MATVPMLAPNGQTGEIPQDKVQDALKAGFKQAVEMTSPDGKIGYIPVDRQQDALKAGFKLNIATPEEAPDTRNSIQKSFDENTKTSPSDSPLGTLLKSTVSAIGSPFVHPVDTITGMIQAYRHPIDTAHAEVDQMYADKAAGGIPYAAAKFAGNALGSVALGEAGGAAIRTLPKPTTVLGRAALLGKTPEAAYESALRPSTTLSQAERSAIVNTGLKEGIPISKAGLEKLQGSIQDLNKSIADNIAKDPNRPIDPNKVATRADAAKAKFRNQVNAQGDLDAIEASKNQFLKENPSLGAADAQAMKQGTYRVLKGKFGEQGSASVEAQKALARGLKEEIATQFPEIAKLNAQESRLLDLSPVLERAVNRISNHQAIGIGTPVAGAAAEAVTGSGGAGVVASVLKGVLDNPSVKSRLAIAISKSSKIPISQAMARVQAYSLSLGSTAGASRESSSGDNPNLLATPQP